MKTPVDASDRGNAICRGGQLRGNFGVLSRPALQRKQAYDHLHAVQEPMIGLLAQSLLLSNQLFLFAKQSLISGECLSQSNFSAPVSCELAFVARGVRYSGLLTGAIRCEVAVRGEYSMVIWQSFPVSRPRRLDTRTKVNFADGTARKH